MIVWVNDLGVLRLIGDTCAGCISPLTRNTWPRKWMDGWYHAKSWLSISFYNTESFHSFHSSSLSVYTVWWQSHCKLILQNNSATACCYHSVLLKIQGFCVTMTILGTLISDNEWLSSEWTNGCECACVHSSLCTCLCVCHMRGWITFTYSWYWSTGPWATPTPSHPFCLISLYWLACTLPFSTTDNNYFVFVLSLQACYHRPPSGGMASYPLASFHCPCEISPLQTVPGAARWLAFTSHFVKTELCSAHHVRLLLI